ncbi:MAG: hypothetical protein ABSF83_07600 [Nitrososphaerales archaeon]
MSLDDTIAIVTLATGLITAIGVFAGPYFAESLRSSRIARRDHYIKIKQGCLKPLADSIGELLTKSIRPSESFYAFGFNDQNQPPPSTVPSLMPGPIILQVVQGPFSQQEVVPFNNLLFADLVHHFPDLKNDIDRVESKVLPSHGKRFMDARWRIGQALWFQLEKKIDSSKHNLADVVRGGLCYACGVPEGIWPNIYVGITRDNTIDLIKEVLAKPEIVRLIPEYKMDQKIVDEELSKLLLEIEEILESEKELKGKCNYL